MFRILIIFFCLCSTVEAAFTIRNGKITDADLVPTMGVQDHFSAGMKAIEKKRWKEAQKQLGIVVYNFPDSPFAQEGVFFLGVAYFERHDFEYADKFFTEYLTDQRELKRFEEAAEYKLKIGDKFANGARTRLLGMKSLPKVFASTKRGYRIYDEIVSMLPGHDVAAKALFNKGMLLKKERRFADAVMTLQQLINAFPKNERVGQAYVAISEVYIEQAAREVNNPDLLPLAEINIRRFENHLPSHPKIQEIRANLVQIKEHYAKGLFEMGQFYERTGKPKASVLYYLTAIRTYPETKMAGECRARLGVLEQYTAELQIKESEKVM